MSIIEVLYPIDSKIVYGTELIFRYNIQNNKKINYLKFVVLQLNSSDEIRVPWTDKTYTFTNITSGDNFISGYLEDISGKKIDNSDFKKSFVCISEKYDPSNPAWLTITDKLPAFIREDYKTFTSFIKAYFEWLHKSNNPIYPLYNSGDFSNIDLSPELFLKKFIDNYLNDFPANVIDLKNTLDLKTVIKNIKNLYLSKGTENSFKFLFRLLYKTYVKLEYPRDKLIKASGNLWVENKKIRIRGSRMTAASLKDCTIYQYLYSDTTVIRGSARIVNVKVLKIESDLIYELLVENVVGSFGNYSAQTNLNNYLNNGVLGEEAYIDIVTSTGIEKHKVYLVNAISSVNITTSGLHTGQLIQVIPKNGAIGNSFLASISEISDNGTPISINIIDFGYDYMGSVNPSTSDFDIVLNVLGTITVLQGTIVINKLLLQSGYWLVNDTAQQTIGSYGILPDNKKYQNMSYVLKTNIEELQFIETIKKLIHPAGFAVFTEPYVESLDQSLNYNEKLSIDVNFSPLLGSFLPYRLNGSLNLRDTGNDSFPDLFPNGFDPTSPNPYQNPGSDLYVHDTTTNGPLDDGANTLRISFTPDVSDSNKLTNYWVVYPSFSYYLGTSNPIKDLTIGDVIRMKVSQYNSD